jgi:hypothetical protein
MKRMAVTSDCLGESNMVFIRLAGVFGSNGIEPSLLRDTRCKTKGTARRCAF